jgi:hypothetical protein
MSSYAQAASVTTSSHSGFTARQTGMPGRPAAVNGAVDDPAIAHVSSARFRQERILVREIVNAFADGAASNRLDSTGQPDIRVCRRAGHLNSPVRIYVSVLRAS